MTSWLLPSVILFIVLANLFAFALCRAAALGDEDMDRAIREERVRTTGWTAEETHEPLWGKQPVDNLPAPGTRASLRQPGQRERHTTQGQAASGAARSPQRGPEGSGRVSLRLVERKLYEVPRLEGRAAPVDPPVNGGAG